MTLHFPREAVIIDCLIVHSNLNIRSNVDKLIIEATAHFFKNSRMSSEQLQVGLSLLYDDSYFIASNYFDLSSLKVNMFNALTICAYKAGIVFTELNSKNR